LKDSRRELTDYQNAIEVMKKKLAEVQSARELKAKAAGRVLNRRVEIAVQTGE
jgi:hypothetical protein